MTNSPVWWLIMEVLILSLTSLRRAQQVWLRLGVGRVRGWQGSAPGLCCFRTPPGSLGTSAWQVTRAQEAKCHSAGAPGPLPALRPLTCHCPKPRSVGPRSVPHRMLCVLSPPLHQNLLCLSLVWSAREEWALRVSEGPWGHLLASHCSPSCWVCAHRSSIRTSVLE